MHVVPSSGRWSIISSGASRASRTFDTQGEAVQVARSKAKKSGTEMYIHGKDGKIRERNSYGKDPFPPKG